MDILTGDGFFKTVDNSVIEFNFENLSNSIFFIVILFKIAKPSSINYWEERCKDKKISTIKVGCKMIIKIQF